MPYQPLKISTEKPVLSWADHDLASAEMQMAKNVASLPFVYKHVALIWTLDKKSLLAYILR